MAFPCGERQSAGAFSPRPVGEKHEPTERRRSSRVKSGSRDWKVRPTCIFFNRNREGGGEPL